jgi:hypothetical protein
MSARVKLPDVHLKRPPEPERRRSRQPVRRNSLMTGPWEDQFIRPIDWTLHDDIARAAERFDRDRKNREAGERNGPIGSIGLELLRELLKLARNCEGKVFPTLTTLAERIGRCKSTVVAYLRRLADLKIVKWARRIEPADGEWERGPQVKQISNLYRLSLPKALQRYVRRPKPPADEAARKAAMLAQLKAYEREEAAEGIDAAIAKGKARAEAMNAARRSGKERESIEPAQTAPNSESDGVRVPRTGLFASD